MVWTDGRRGFPAASEDIFGRRIDGSGAKLGADFRINRPIPPEMGTTLVGFPAVAFNNPDQVYLVVWEDGRRDPSIEIFGRRIAADGDLLGRDFRISRGRGV